MRGDVEKLIEARQRAAKEDRDLLVSGGLGTAAGLGTSIGLSRFGMAGLGSDAADEESTRELLVKMFGNEKAKEIIDAEGADFAKVRHPIDAEDIGITRDFHPSLPPGPFYLRPIDSLGRDAPSDHPAFDLMDPDNRGIKGLINRTTGMDTPEAFLHEFAHSTKKGRLLLGANPFLKTLSGTVVTPALIGGAAYAARKRDAKREDSTEESRDRATVRAALGAGALTTAAAAPLLYEEARANLGAARLAKKYNHAIKKRRLLKAFGTYAGVPLGFSVMPTAGIVLGMRARKKKREEEKKRLEKKSSLLPFYARLMESQA